MTITTTGTTAVTGAPVAPVDARQVMAGQIHALWRPAPIDHAGDAPVGTWCGHAELRQDIAKRANHYGGDHATIDAIIRMMVESGALIARYRSDRTLEYRRGVWPKVPSERDVSHGGKLFNDNLRQRAKEEREMRERGDRVAQATHTREREAYIQVMRDTVREMLPEITAAVVAALAGLDEDEPEDEDTATDTADTADTTSVVDRLRNRNHRNHRD